MCETRSGQAPLAGLNILVVEDDPFIRLDLASGLEDLGARVCSASDVAAALACLGRIAIDFAVFDFELTGETTETAAVQAKQAGVPFLFLSGYGERDGHFAHWPHVAVLVKPVSIASISRAIQHALGRETID